MSGQEFRVGQPVWVCDVDLETDSSWSAGFVQYVGDGKVLVRVPGRGGISYSAGRSVLGFDPVVKRDPALNGADRPEE